MINVSAYHLVS